MGTSCRLKRRKDTFSELRAQNSPPPIHIPSHVSACLLPEEYSLLGHYLPLLNEENQVMEVLLIYHPLTCRPNTRYKEISGTFLDKTQFLCTKGSKLSTQVWEKAIRKTRFQDGDTFMKLYCSCFPHPDEVTSLSDLQFNLHSQGDNAQ